MESLEIAVDDINSRSQRTPIRLPSDDGISQRARSPHRKPSVTLSEVMQSIQDSQYCENPYAVTAEFFGTFAFLFTTTLGVTYSNGETINVATSYGITLAVVIFITAPVSGGHINPAVSFALALHRHLSWTMCAYYVTAQMAGGVVGVAVAYGVADELIGNIFVNDKVSFVSAFFGEVVGTWFLITTVFATAVETSSGKITKSKISLGAMAPMIIGWSVWAIHFALIGVTGCGVNPARYLATALVLNKWRWNQVWIYFLGPLVGALISLPTYKILYHKTRANN